MGANIGAAYSLVGEKVWKAFFAEKVVVKENVCPMILRQLIFRQLMYYVDTFAKAKEDAKKQQVDEAAKLLKAASTEHMQERKKLRQSPYGVS